MIYLTLDSWGRFSCPTAGLLGLLSLSRPEKVLKHIQSISIIVCTFKKVYMMKPFQIATQKI